MTTKTDEQERSLLPCPFCGGNVDLVIGFETFEAAFVDCPTCGVSGRVFEQPQDAAQNWNRRSALQSQAKYNDLMLSAVLRMPFDMAMADEISRLQFYHRAQQALNELEALQSQDREDAVERLIEALRNYMIFGCPVCSGDCFSANPPVSGCPARDAQEAIDHARRIEGESNADV